MGREVSLKFEPLEVIFALIHSIQSFYANLVGLAIAMLLLNFSNATHNAYLLLFRNSLKSTFLSESGLELLVTLHLARDFFFRGLNEGPQVDPPGASIIQNQN